MKNSTLRIGKLAGAAALTIGLLSKDCGNPGDPEVGNNLGAISTSTNSGALKATDELDEDCDYPKGCYCDSNGLWIGSDGKPSQASTGARIECYPSDESDPKASALPDLM